ncbi:hypothetical protein OIU78_022929, partial [Salix suchowensis]
MDCIMSSCAALSTQSRLSAHSLPTSSTSSTRSIKPSSLSWGFSFPTIHISINHNPPSPLNK